jgi:hypothetical protein
MAAMFHNGFMPGRNTWDKLTETEKTIVDSVPHVLESYHYVGKDQYAEQLRATGKKVFLDSGAFSAWTLGATLSLDAYCDYICKHWDIIRYDEGRTLMASVLDGIGNAEETWQNQQAMEANFRARGWPVCPLPCFHFGEPEYYLERYLAGYEYITIGGMVGKPTDQLRTWLDRIWNKHMVDGSGRPRIKVHAFGVTSIPLMEEYPWYSCDSSSWVQMAAFGNIVVPGIRGMIAVSGKSPARHEAGKHVSTLSPPEVEHVHRILEAHGFTYERLSEDTYARRAWNMLYYRQVEASINASKGSKYRTHVRELF